MELDRLNSIISEKRREMERLYSAVGKAYYEKHKDDSEADMPEMLSQINALTDEISTANQDIEKIKRWEKCPSCGTDLLGDSAYCHKCGAAIIREDPIPEGMKKCPQCGSLVEKDHVFCSKCGARFASATDTRDPSLPNGMKKCPQCGSLVDYRNAFCTKCGSKL